MACAVEYGIEGLDKPLASPADPVAEAGPGGRTKRQLPFTLDGTASMHPDPHGQLTYHWTLETVPDGADAQLLDADTPHPQLVSDTLGLHHVSLVVEDEHGTLSANDTLTRVEVVPWEDLSVELTWDLDGVDLDLHLLAPSADYYSDGDCFFGNPAPDWGTPGDATDDPRLDRDADADAGPERIVMDRPGDGTYGIRVHYYSARDQGGALAIPTITVHAEGEPLMTSEGAPLAPGEVWDVGALRWDDLTWTTTDRITTHAALGGPDYNVD
jgi:hypothetical protein